MVTHSKEPVLFDESGNIIKNKTDLPPNTEKLKKDPDASQMFETHMFVKGEIKSKWYSMSTNKQRVLFFIALVVGFFMLAEIVKYDVERSNKKYQEELQSRIKRGCKYPTKMITTEKGIIFPTNPDEGCRSE